MKFNRTKIWTKTLVFASVVVLSTAPSLSVQAKNNVVTQTEKKSSIFQKLPNYFYFSSGAGAWSTELEIDGNGEFTGVFHDADMGDSGVKYPNGTVHICNFSGKFSNPKKIDKYTYSITLKKIKTEKKAGKTFYDDGFRYITSTPYGLEGAKKFIVYLPGKKIAQISKGAKDWFSAYGIDRTKKTLENYYLIYNTKGGETFAGK